jgi:hypothetical protein
METSQAKHNAPSPPVYLEKGGGMRQRLQDRHPRSRPRGRAWLCRGLSPLPPAGTTGSARERGARKLGIPRRPGRRLESPEQLPQSHLRPGRRRPDPAVQP